MFFKPRKHSNKSSLSLKERLDRLDVFGSALLFGAAIMFFLTLNYADLGAHWNDPLIIGLLVGCGASALAFVVWQLYRGDKALLPPALLRNSTVPFACLNATFLYSTLLIHAYYLSIWFQVSLALTLPPSEFWLPC